MIDHRTGNGCPPMSTMKGSGSLSARATQGPKEGPDEAKGYRNDQPAANSPRDGFPRAPQRRARDHDEKQKCRLVTVSWQVPFRVHRRRVKEALLSRGPFDNSFRRVRRGRREGSVRPTS